MPTPAADVFLESANGSYGISGHNTTGYSGNTLFANNGGGGMETIEVIPAHGNSNGCLGSCS
jgi:hypothetical protein